MRELLIAGAGIAGLNAAIAATRRGSTHVTLIDAHGYQTLAPQLARGAAGSASFGQMAVDLPEDGASLTRVRAVIERVDPAGKSVVAGGQEYRGDKLIIAVGRGPARGPAISEGQVFRPYHAEAASRLRLAWHGALAAAARRRPLPGEPVRLVIVGGGAFGCELALAFAAVRPVACERYGLPQEMVEIHLCEAEPRLLPDWPERAAVTIGRECYLSEVETRLAARAVARTVRGIRFEDGSEQPADIVVWACGREPNGLIDPARFSVDDHNSVITDGFLRVAGYGDVYAIGDCASTAGGWDRAVASARVAVANATSRLPKQKAEPVERRRFVNLPMGRVMIMRDGRFAANAWPLVCSARLLAERYTAGGLPMLLQAWPAAAPDHSLAAWRDAAERRRGRHAERRI